MKDKAYCGNRICFGSSCNTPQGLVSHKADSLAECAAAVNEDPNCGNGFSYGDDKYCDCPPDVPDRVFDCEVYDGGAQELPSGYAIYGWYPKIHSSNTDPPPGFTAKQGSGPCQCTRTGWGLDSCGALCCANSPFTSTDPTDDNYYGNGGYRTVENLCWEEAGTFPLTMTPWPPAPPPPNLPPTSPPNPASTSASDSAPPPAPPSPPVFVVLEGPCHAGNDAEGQTCICSSNYAQECDVRVEDHYGSSEECVITYDADNFDTNDQGKSGRFLYPHQMDISLSINRAAASYKSFPGYGNDFTQDKLWTGNLPLKRGNTYDKNRIDLDTVATFNQGFHAINVVGTNAIAFWSSKWSDYSDERGGWKICTTPPRTDTGVIAAYVSGPVLACLCFCCAIFYMIRRSRRRSGNARAQRAASVGALRAAAAQRASSVRRALSIPMGTVVTSQATPSTTGVVVSGVVLTSTAEAPGVVVSGAVARAVVEPTKQDPGGSSTVDTSGEPLAERLVRLKELLAAGALTQQEYEGKRDEIMEEVGL